MAVIESTGWAAMKVAAFAAAFQYGCIEVYDGEQAANADQPPPGLLLARITANGGAWVAGSNTNGLRFVAGGRYVLKDAAQTWVMKGIATGTARSFRVLPNVADAGLLSLDALRIDGAIGLTDDIGGGDVQLYLPSLDIIPATSQAINNWWYAVPPIGA
jgi:hypothetical protein